MIKIRGIKMHQLSTRDTTGYFPMGIVGDLRNTMWILHGDTMGYEGLLGGFQSLIPSNMGVAKSNNTMI